MLVDVKFLIFILSWLQCESEAVLIDPNDPSLGVKVKTGSMVCRLSVGNFVY